MNLPKIKIAGYLISVEKDENMLANRSRIGEYSPFEQKIRIAEGLTHQQQSETLIHEILEAIDAIYELGLDHDEQLSKLSVIIHQVIQDNKTLINALHPCELPKFCQQQTS